MFVLCIGCKEYVSIARTVGILGLSYASDMFVRSGHVCSGSQGNITNVDEDEMTV